MNIDNLGHTKLLMNENFNEKHEITNLKFVARSDWQTTTLANRAMGNVTECLNVNFAPITHMHVWQQPLHCHPLETTDTPQPHHVAINTLLFIIRIKTSCRLVTCTVNEEMCAWYNFMQML